MSAVLGSLQRITPARFLWLTLLSIVVSRALIIAATPAYGGLIDLSMYREVGQLVLHDIDPYDFQTNRALREQLRLDGQGGDAYVSEFQDRYDYFVSSNLPGSTLLFALFEWISGGNPVLWRAALALGDLLMAFGAYLLCLRAGVDLGRIEHKLGFFTLLVAYPSLLMWGTVVPEDKQFQTGFMLLVGALLLPVPGRAAGPSSALGSVRTPSSALGSVRTPSSALGSVRTPSSALGEAAALGGTLALSILFKALGAILLPAVARHLAGRPRRELLWFGLAFAAAAVLIVAPFSTSFVQLIARRLHGGSIEQARHGSLWALLPWPAAVTFLRPAAVLIALAVLASGYLTKKVDLLNALAGTLVTFICVWITNGSMDRQNITMIFACFCLVTAVPEHWWKLALANAAFQAIAYAGSILRYGADSDPIETCDGANTAFFLLGYFALLVQPLLKPAVRTRSAAT